MCVRVTRSWLLIILLLSACDLRPRSSTGVDAPDVVELILSPTNATLSVEGLQQFSVYGRMNTGDSTGVPVSYSATGGTVSASGVYTAGSIAGVYRLIARHTDGTVADTAAITITSVAPPPPPPPPSAPGTVGDLAAMTVTDTALTLSFTEVDDGTGQPASYDVRFGPASISWGGLPSVTRGTCATPVAGTAIGTRRTCTVLGLKPGTTYEFQVVAFRGTLGLDAVFGSLSNIARATTAPSTAPVATVTVSPASATVTLGATQQLSVVLKDASGSVLTGRSVTWTSSDPLVASVSSSGLVTGLLAGLASITATSEGVSGSAGVTITTSTSTHIGSPNLEPGLVGRTDLVLFEDFEYADWLTHWSGGYVVDPATLLQTTSPVFKGTRALEVRVPKGSHYGVELDFTFAKKGLPEPDEIYLRYYVRFNDSWQISGDGQLGKFPGFGGTYNRCGWGSGIPDGTCWSARMASYDVGTGNQVGFYTYHLDQSSIYGDILLWQPTLVRGQWYCIEAHVKLNSVTGSSANYDGVLRGWIDGAAAYARTNMRFRNVTTTHVEKIWWNIYIGGTWTADRDMAVHYDNVVVAKQRIGC